jgi:hypothetical protein
VAKEQATQSPELGELSCGFLLGGRRLCRTKAPLLRLLWQSQLTMYIHGKVYIYILSQCLASTYFSSSLCRHAYVGHMFTGFYKQFYIHHCYCLQHRLWNCHAVCVETGDRHAMGCGSQEWLQIFAWTEKELPVCLATRDALMRGVHKGNGKEQPMFCFETGIKLLYWSGLAYEHDEVTSTRRLSCLLHTEVRNT